MPKKKKAVKKKTVVTKKSNGKSKVTKPRAIKKKNDLMLVRNPTNKEQEFFVATELADDAAIEAELLGQAMESFIYQYTDKKGNLITGMSVSGVNEISRRMTKNPKSGIKIRIIPDSIKIERDVVMNGEKGIQVTLIAENMVTGETGIGVKFETYENFSRNGKYKNTFVVEKALSKAERNAKRKLIPEKTAIEMIKMFVNKGSVKQIAKPAYNSFQRPAVTPQIDNTNHLSDLVKYLANEAGVVIKDGKPTGAQLTKMIDLYNDYTGESIKSLKIGQPRAKVMLHNLLTSPMMANKQ